MSNIGQEDFRVELDDGKYKVIALVGGGFRWLRHDKEWPAAEDLTYSKVVVSMIYRINELEVALHKTQPKGDAAEIGQRAAHYGDGVQPWDHIKAAGWGPEFAAGNALKYVRRYKTKNGEDDLKKGRWYYAELINLVGEELPDHMEHVDSLRHPANFALQRLDVMLTQEERALLRQQP